MSTVEQTQPKRNKETIRSTTDFLHWSIGESSIYVVQTPRVEVKMKLYCTMCAVLLSSKGAILSIKWTKSGNKRRVSSNMTSHEMILLCSSLQGVKRWIPLCLVVGFATFVALGSPHLRLDTCRSMPQHAAACHSTANFSWGPLVPCWPRLIAACHRMANN